MINSIEIKNETIESTIENINELEKTCQIESDYELAVRLSREWHNETVNNDNQHHFNSGKIHVFQKTDIIQDDQIEDNKHDLDEVVSIESDDVDVKEELIEDNNNNEIDKDNKINDKMSEDQFEDLNINKRKRNHNEKLCIVCQNATSIKMNCGHY